jgi:hypothetical protein
MVVAIVVVVVMAMHTSARPASMPSISLDVM